MTLKNVFLTLFLAPKRAFKKFAVILLTECHSGQPPFLLSIPFWLTSLSGLVRLASTSSQPPLLVSLHHLPASYLISQPPILSLPLLKNSFSGYLLLSSSPCSLPLITPFSGSFAASSSDHLASLLSWPASPGHPPHLTILPS